MSSLANIYKVLMKKRDYNEWFGFLQSILDDFNIKDCDILDLGCGTGELLIKLKENGYRVMGVDISPEMLSFAQDKIKNSKYSMKDIPLVNQDMRELKLPVGFDCIISIFDTVNYLFDEQSLKEMFIGVNKHLDKGGYFIFDTATRKLMNEIFENGFYFEDRDDITIMWEHYYNEKEDIDNISAINFLKDENCYKRFDEFYQKKIFKIEKIKKILKETGFVLTKEIIDEKLAGERIFFVVKKENEV